MSSVFADTSAWYALISPRDTHHAAATTFLQTHPGTFLTTNYVVAETANLLLYRLGATSALEFLAILGESRLVEVLCLSAEQHERAAALFAQLASKGLSFTDCSSVLVMQEQRLTHAFCFDQDFSRAGLACVP